MKVAQNFKKHVRRRIIQSRLAGRFDENNVFVLTSSPRSGSTWLGNVLGTATSSCIPFEPLQLREVSAAQEAGFTWRTYVAPENEWLEGEAFLRNVFRGLIVNDWTIREMSFREAWDSKTMLIKFVRANRLLPWICKRFNLPTPILLLRHPCAVIASQLKSEDWNRAERPEAPSYIMKYSRYKSALAETKGVEENLAALWSLDQLPADATHEGPSLKDP